MADCCHLSVRVSTHLDPQTTFRGVGVRSERLFLSLSRTPSQPEEIDQHVLPAAVDSGRVAQKEQIPAWGGEEGNCGAISLPCSQLSRPHPGYKLLWVNVADFLLLGSLLISFQFRFSLNDSH